MFTEECCWTAWLQHYKKCKHP